MFTRSDRLRPNTILSRLSGTEGSKSIVDDFDIERGIVSMRVGLSYDLLRLSPCSGDLYANLRGQFSQENVALHPPNTPNPTGYPHRGKNTPEIGVHGGKRSNLYIKELRPKKHF